MSFDAEWAALRAESSQRVDMRLNSLPAEGGSGPANADLAVNQDNLGAIGHDAYEVRTRLSKDGDHARPTTFDAAIALTNGNFTSGSALMKVHDRWQTHMKTLLDACAQISNHLNYTKSAHSKDDVQIGGDLISVSKLNDYLK
ncbi:MULTISPECIES: hypothetical protein [unclassified Streptomyces]|uniref:hypothetical protein n=1 Tax=unclassified Streptomyces TaxID=2593676 RepID=UPI0009394AEF|nr:hypothetical protein [Streptomyces sp. CB02058]OKI95570.1 hypothetical protein AMK10_07600 [Streptomyces sp. CB02058]